MKIELSDNEKKIIKILCIVLIVAAIIFLPGYIRKQREKLFLMTTRYKIKYVKGKWYNMTDGDDYKLRSFDIYQNGSYFGNYKVLFSNRFTLLNDSEEIIPYEGYLFAAGGNIKVRLYDNDLNEVATANDDELVKQALSEIGIDSNAYFNIHQKVTIDVNNDDADEVIYYVDNIKEPDIDSLDGITGPVPDTNGNNFSLLFMFKNGKVYIIDKIITNKNEFKNFEILNIIDIRENNKLELIYNEGERYSTFSDCVKLYDLAKNKEIHDFCK